MKVLLVLVCTVLAADQVYSQGQSENAAASEECFGPCPSNPCHPLLAPWCKKWYPRATCVETGCCKTVWYKTEEQTQQNRIICQSLVCPPEEDIKDDDCNKLCKAGCQAGRMCCDNSCGTKSCALPVPPSCPNGKPSFYCSRDPCAIFKPDCLGLFKEAVCLPNFCGGCNFNWYETEAMDRELVCPKPCSREKRRCSDGSKVRRDPTNNCEFYPCPVLCPIDVKTCRDGTVVERNPKNDCNFFPCPKSDIVEGCPKPKEKDSCPTKPAEDGCKSAKDCRKKEKCCMVNTCYEMQCVPISAPKAGHCPKADKSIECAAQDAIACGRDDDCKGDEKCCKTSCGGRMCSEPMPCYPKGTDMMFGGGKCQCEWKKEGCGGSKKCTKATKSCPRGQVCCCPAKSWSEACGKK